MWSFWQGRLFTASLKFLFRIINLLLTCCRLADLPTSFPCRKYLPACQSMLRSSRRVYEEKQRKQRKHCEERDVGCLRRGGGAKILQVGERSDWSERKEEAGKDGRKTERVNPRCCCCCCSVFLKLPDAVLIWGWIELSSSFIALLTPPGVLVTQHVHRSDNQQTTSPKQHRSLHELRREVRVEKELQRSKNKNKPLPLSKPFFCRFLALQVVIFGC